MKTIDEAATEFSENVDTQIGFKGGAEFAQKWISVNDDLPEYTTCDIHNVVLVKFTTTLGYIRECTATLETVSQHCFENSSYYDRWYVYPSGGHELKNVTHWRPIEIK